MTTHTADLSGAAGDLSSGYTQAFFDFVQRNGSSQATGVGGEECCSLRTAETYGNDQQVTFRRLSVTGATVAGVVRGSISGTLNGYAGHVSSVNNWAIYRVTGGTSNLLASGTTGVDHAVNDIFRFKVSGTLLELIRNSVVIGSYDTASDGTKYSSGSPGAYTFSTPLFDQLVFEDIGPAGPSITGVSDTTPANGSSLTVTGSGFGASQGTQQLRMGGEVQAITSWADGIIVVTALDRVDNPYGPLDIEIWDGGVPTSNAFEVSLEPQAGWDYINVGTPHPDPDLRLEVVSGIEPTSGDQVAYDTVGGTVTLFPDLTGVVYGDTESFLAEAWTAGDGWGTAGLQSFTTPQRLFPTATVSAGSWVSALGGSLHAALSESSPDDASHVYTNQAGDWFEVEIEVAVDPATGYGHVPGYRISGNGTSGLLVEVRQGTTVIASFTHDPAPTAWTTYFQVLEPAEADSITDYAAPLRLRFTEV
jgi:hypothetical protein